VSSSGDAEAIVTSGDFRYRADPAWARWPGDWQIREVTAVATDSRDRVFVFSRGDHSVAVFDPSGELLFAWGQGLFTRPHGITIGPDDAVYCTDDLDHTVRKFTAEGSLLMTLGTSGQPADTGATSLDYRTIRRAGEPFHYPTNLAVAKSGELYVSDGYGNARIHRFSADGKLLASWGEPGSGKGQFHVPHGLAVDRHGTVYVADRENSRIQLFSPDGEFLREWTDVARPCDVAIDSEGRAFVAELGHQAGRWPGWGPCPTGATGGRVSIFDSAGKLLARFGGGERPCAAGDFFAPHDIWLDARGDFYVAEVIRSASGNQQPPAADYHTLQKFTRV
jgi:DNA-binding beta-propeller fold protein YncE